MSETVKERSILVTGKNFYLVSNVTGLSVAEVRRRYLNAEDRGVRCVIHYRAGDGNDG